MEFDEQAAIGEFWIARSSGDYFPPAWFDRLTIDEAYRIQLGIVARQTGLSEPEAQSRAALLGVSALAFTASSASAAIVCNEEGDCWQPAQIEHEPCRNRKLGRSGEVELPRSHRGR